MRRYRVQKLSATSGTNRLFFDPARKSVVKIINVNNDKSPSKVNVEIINDADPDDTNLTISLFQARYSQPGRDISWKDLKNGIEFDGTQRIRATFYLCQSGDSLFMTIGVS